MEVALPEVHDPAPSVGTTVTPTAALAVDTESSRIVPDAPSRSLAPSRAGSSAGSSLARSTRSYLDSPASPRSSFSHRSSPQPAPSMAKVVPKLSNLIDDEPPVSPPGFRLYHSTRNGTDSNPRTASSDAPVQKAT